MTATESTTETIDDMDDLAVTTDTTPTGTVETGTELDDFDALTARYGRELLAHCYRMSGSSHEAEDLLQETLLRAWKSSSGFQGRSSVRTWLYRIATNVCLTNLEGPPAPPAPLRPRHARPACGRRARAGPRGGLARADPRRRGGRRRA